MLDEATARDGVCRLPAHGLGLKTAGRKNKLALEGFAVRPENAVCKTIGRSPLRLWENEGQAGHLPLAGSR